MRLQERRQNSACLKVNWLRFVWMDSSHFIGNYEAGSRNVGVYDAVVLGEALGISPPETSVLVKRTLAGMAK